VSDLMLCEVRLQRDARFPWLILIPKVAGARELEDLAGMDRARLMDEIVLAGRPVAKLNIGALGNITPQLHIHVVGRRADDMAWPGPVWGTAGGVDYEPEARRIAMAAARSIAA
jgi:diadenosine tetraphosphate (Ap4A) HIT family hydrolase